MSRLCALLFLPALFGSVFSISFYLPVNSRKCLREEIHKDVLVTGEYEVSEQPNTKTNLKQQNLNGDVNLRLWRDPGEEADSLYLTKSSMLDFR
ncbi:Transmembrane emp24 domain-containing protein 10 [Acipenser ruthenus]|uniref:Transmembrane emp24 domain-containing protein 10 n=1 Tax=Acipenser ruthenus TaxID=7906 RepID=A0A444URT6_ACIRT|nr:Transmembrane emp24 domain-containing protein 10 [Acipenser ruthenus]